MNKTYLLDLISGLEQGLLRLDYTKGSMTFHRRRRNQLMAYAEDRGECYYMEQPDTDFLKEFFGITQGSFSRTLPQAKTQEIRIVHTVGDFQLHRAMPRRYLKHKELLITPFFVNIRSRLQSPYEKKNYSQATMEHYVKQSSYLMDYLIAQGMDNFTAATLDTISTCTRTLAGFPYKTVEQHICSLRALFRFLNQEGIIPDDSTAKMSVVKTRKQTAISSVQTQEELKQLVRAIDQGSPGGKRDHAIILIACRLGLRCIDIGDLCFENLNWTEKKLCPTQSRIGQPMGLPLIPDVGWAVIDYLKYGRPKADSSRIFVRHTAPFLPSAEGDHLDQLIGAYMVKARTSMRGKHRGIYSLRHTVASVLLEKDTLFPVISDTIRHLDTNSTVVYLKANMERLTEYPLDFEEVIHLG